MTRTAPNSCAYRGGLAGVFVAAAGLACQASDPPQILFGGCAEITRSSICRVVPTSTLTVWIAAEQPQIALDEKTVHAPSIPVDGGHQFKIPIPESAKRLTVRARGARRAWSLTLQPFTPHPALSAARKLRSRGKFDRARATIKPLLSHRDARLRAQAASLMARLAFSQADYSTAIDKLERSMTLHRELGARSAELDDQLARIFMLRRMGRFDEAFRAANGLDPLLVNYPAGRIKADYFRLNAAVDSHDYRRALELGPRILQDIKRIDEPAFGRVTRSKLVETFAHLGRHDDAAPVLAELIQQIPKGPPCVRTHHSMSAGHAAVRLAHDATSREKARQVLKTAIVIHQSECPQAQAEAYALALLGLLALADGDTQNAARHLEASIAVDAPFVRLPALAQSRLTARLAMAEGRLADAMQAYRRLSLLGAYFSDAPSELDGLIGQGEVAQKGGRTSTAIDLYEQTEVALDRLSFRAPIGAGRQSLLSGRTTSAERLVDLLMQQNRMKEAVGAARRSRLRAMLAMVGLSRLHAVSASARVAWYRASAQYRKEFAADGGRRIAWNIPSDELARQLAKRRHQAETARRLLDRALSELGAALPATLDWRPPGADEVVLAFHPVVDGWAGFAITAESTVGDRLEKIDPRAPPAELARRLLAPFAKQIEQKQKIRLLTVGILNRVDLHALPWRGRPLIANKAVSYSVDLPVRHDAVTTERSPVALVVDPHHELKETIKEAAHATKILSKADWTVHALSGERVRRDRLVAQLSNPDLKLFHYAGHAQFLGLDGWQSHLGQHPDPPLLTIADILTLPSAPHWVILSGCETAVDTAAPGTFGLGLAQAFVVAGTEWVVASVRPIGDDDALEVARRFHIDRLRQGHHDAASALAAAQAHIAKARPTSAWSTFRLITP
ncbi:MAG: CHAT domain-containing protein [Myxococcota bacterium]